MRVGSNVEGQIVLRKKYMSTAKVLGCFSIGGKRSQEGFDAIM